jgi:hypothetical protein
MERRRGKGLRVLPHASCSRAWRHLSPELTKRKRVAFSNAALQKSAAHAAPCLAAYLLAKDSHSLISAAAGLSAPQAVELKAQSSIRRYKQNSNLLRFGEG